MAIVVTGLIDLARVVGLGVVEVTIGVAAAMVSLASLTGVYRVDQAAAEQPAIPGEG